MASGTALPAAAIPRPQTIDLKSLLFLNEFDAAAELNGGGERGVFLKNDRKDPMLFLSEASLPVLFRVVSELEVARHGGEASVMTGTLRMHKVYRKINMWAAGTVIR